MEEILPSKNEHKEKYNNVIMLIKATVFYHFE